MKIEKMSLKGIKNVLSRAEMKQILAGSSGDGTCQNECGGSTGEVCGAGYTCSNVVCPDDANFLHNICTKN